MKKTLLIFCVCIIFLFSSCSIGGNLPNNGIWYCEELKTSIDFSKYQKGNNECAYFYDEDGNYELRKCLIDFGTKIGISSINEEELYCIGNFKFKTDTFVITTVDGVEYVFIEQSVEGQSGDGSVIDKKKDK